MLDKPISNASVQGYIESIQDHPTKPKKDRVFLRESKNRVIKLISNKNQFDVGDIVKIKCDLMPIFYPTSLFSPNWRRYHYLLSIGATGRIKQIESVTHSNNSLNKYRHQLTKLLKSKIEGVNGAIAASLVTGDRSSIPSNIKQNFADSGIAHVLAISGLHVSLVIGVIFLFIRRTLSFIPRIALFYPIRSMAAIVSIVASFAYLAISGFGYPAIRAFIMSCFVLIGLVIGRQPFSIRSVCIAAIIILTIYPESILSLSFQLSFVAVAALITGYEFLYGKISHYSGMARFFINLFSTTIIASIATTPIIMDSFGRITIQSILGNFIAIPLVSFLIMPSFVACLLTCFKIQFLIDIYSFGIDLLVKTATKIANLPGAAITIAKPNDFFLPFFYISFILICIFKRKEGGIFLFMAFFSLFFKKQFPEIYVDKNVIAYVDGDKLFASSLKNKFAIDTWMKESNIKNLYLWTSFVVNFNSYRLTIDHWKHGFPNFADSLTITNGYMHGKVAIDRKMLEKLGNCFVINGSIKCVKETMGDRPWS